MRSLDSPTDIAAALDGARFVSAEFMYKPPPEGRAGVVFDVALRSRLDGLNRGDGVLFLCDSPQTALHFDAYSAAYPHLNMVAVVTNPTPLAGGASTPFDWDGSWTRYDLTDRWARIRMALQVGERLRDGYLVMPAHDAVWGRGLLARLVAFSQCHAKGGQPAAVSPYTPYQHSAAAEAPSDLIHLLNTAFNRDPLFPLKIRTDRVQAFWGKMGMIPFALCGGVLMDAEMMVWEDDLEIDRVIRARGYGVRALWVENAGLYRQALPVFSREDAKRVIFRTLHYSLNIPSPVIGASTLNFPLSPLARLRARCSPLFAHFNREAEQLIAECNDEISARLSRFGASWVDWGAYRYVVRVGDPAVEVWRRNRADNSPNT